MHDSPPLLRKQGLMKTAAGWRMAEQRHAFMEAFMQQFLAEWRGEA
jgi:uncharacterized protein